MISDKRMDELEAMVPNKSFCSAPFLHTHMNVNNRGFKLCCMSHIISRFDDLDSKPLQETLEEFWTGEEMQAMRTQFLNGEMPDVCKWWCGMWDEKGVAANKDRYAFLQKHSNIKKDLDFKWDVKYGTLDYKKPIDIDLRPTKLCNLKCRSCNSIWSDKIEKEVLEHPEIQKWSHWDNVTVSKINEHRARTIDWEDENYDIVSSLDMDDVHYLKISGGETLFDPRIYRMLKRVVDSGHSKNLVLHMIVNGTVLPDRLFKLLHEFKDVRFNLSIDSTGAVEEYLRTGTIWERKLEVIEKMFKVGTVGILCTMQPVVMFNLRDTIKYFIELNDKYGKRFRGVMMNSMVEPWYLHSGWLDHDDKEAIRDEMEHMIFEFNMEEKGIAWWFDTAFVEMDYEFGDKCKRYANDFVRANNALDKIRGTNLLDVCPQMQKYYDRYDPEDVTNALDGNRPAAQWAEGKPKAKSNVGMDKIVIKNVD